MSFKAIVGKELADLAREKRFGGWALTFLAFWGVFLLLFFVDTQQSVDYRRDYPMSMLQLAPFFYFVLAIGLVVLALFVLTDGVTKERESGMLPLVGAKPIVRWHVVLAKLLAGLVVYALAFLVLLVPTTVLAVSLGFPIYVLMFELFTIPFFALYAFMLGAGLLLGVASTSSKVAIGMGAAIYIPLFLVMRQGPLSMLYRSYPAAGEVARYTPFDAALSASHVVAYGGSMPWGPLLVTIGLGVALAAAAFWVFQRQEVAA